MQTPTIPVVFNYLDWVAMFPELGGVNQAAATNYFNLATMFVQNTSGCLVQDPVRLTNLLYLATAHVVFLLSQRTNGVPTTGGIDPPPPIVGRITTATEGSVSVATELPNQPVNAAWWQQTTYGAMVWMMLAPSRTMRYVGSARRRIYNPPVWSRGVGPGFW
jgi:hypothetical protein